VALKQAEAAGLVLVEVAPNSRPPVCKILDYGRFKYEQKKKTKGKPKSTSSVLKEVRVRPKIDVHDLAIKIRKAREFLDAGHKVQVTCLFRGREMAYQSIGRGVMLKVAKELDDIARVERDPRMEGRRMNLMMGKRTTPLIRTSEVTEEQNPQNVVAMPVTHQEDFADLPAIPAKVREPQPAVEPEDNGLEPPEVGAEAPLEKDSAETAETTSNAPPGTSSETPEKPE